MVQPILARRADRTVLAGHQRLTAARREGHRSIPVIWVDLSVERARLLGLALNKITGVFDEDLLAQLLAELGLATDLDITLAGFDDAEVDTLVRRLGGRERRTRPETFDLDAAAAAATISTRTRTGDLWLLGDHRLLVGDATAASDVARVLGGGRTDMVFTDPPYNVALGDHGGQQRGARRRRIENDALSAGAWDVFTHSWAGNALPVACGALYICMSGKEWPTLSAILAELGGHWSTTIVWAKDRFTLGRSDYQRGYEPIWYGWKEGSKHHWCGDRDQSDVWRIDRPSVFMAHPTMKPIELVERAIENSSRPGDLVLDPFVGSGTTIIAAERTGRRCAAIEIDPIHAATAIARWERFTGGTAEGIVGDAPSTPATDTRLLPATVRS